MRQFGLIIFLLIIVSQVVRAIMDRANKSQQEQRLRETAAQRQRQPQSRGASQPMTEAPDRAAQLAARRRSQLQELRRRAVTGTGLQAGPQPTLLGTPTRTPTRTPTLPTTRAPTHTPTSRPTRTPTPFGVPPQGRPPQGRGVPGPPAATPGGPMARPPRVAPRPAPRPTVSTTAAQARQREALLAAVAARKRDEETPEVRDPRRVKASTVQEEAYDISATKRHPLFRGEKRTPELLRKMVVLKELLEPPVSLREQQAWERQ